ncbi:MAG: 23S rRNA (pseudouridine(1915)-N(3))-methyltransferase RlmH [Bacteroidales bacterium]|nr:23S rRNA (pseudouridine(1915)-N(3))-methyltransferase RlmH [Bacteroidales bacterium]MBQ7984941.1 23S rRNA (pseudouridine(1915)-N(3))-methyltransferase RlmH [Bacteroidales bacterium]
MNIRLVVTGKTIKGFVFDGTEEYIKRLKHYTNFTVDVINDVKNAKNLSPTQLKTAEGVNLLAFLEKNQLLSNPAAKIILLDEHGAEFTSKEFASVLQKNMNLGIKNLVFIIGGAYGFPQEIKDRFKDKISVSRMTFSHQMIRLLFTEQLYRAFTILKNEPYHNE